MISLGFSLLQPSHLDFTFVSRNNYFLLNQLFLRGAKELGGQDQILSLG